ncbi:hypothetical protein CFSAN002368_26792 [Clostridium botulinum A1 str. CFSAN002368]|nr:hypothetical protein CFSAN002368_26792 [Clostridium botulinum A1 str. CFSAN002368]
MKVLSTIVYIPFSLAIFDIASISVISIRGLVGVSIYIAFTFSFMLFFTSSRLEVSTIEYLILKLLNTLSKTLKVPPYTLFEITISSPDLNSDNTAVIAANPEAKAKPLYPSSSSAASFF